MLDGAASRSGKAFTCFCEDVSAKDIHRGVQEGYDSIELCKRFTTVTMGPCQGRMCQLSVDPADGRGDRPGARAGRHDDRAAAVVDGAARRARRPADRAGQALLDPRRHRELGARIKWAGDWRRAYDYGDPEGEALAVHAAAGLIDVSTLGKLLVAGPGGRSSSSTACTRTGSRR